MHKLLTDLRTLNESSNTITEESIFKALEQTFLNDSELRFEKFTEIDDLEYTAEDIFNDWFDEFDFMDWLLNYIGFNLDGFVKMLFYDSNTKYFNIVSRQADFSDLKQGKSIFSALFVNSVGVLKDYANKNLYSVLLKHLQDMIDVDNSLNYD